MPNDAAFGFMTPDMLTAYIKHVVRNARKVAPNTEIPLLLLLDGHKSHIEGGTGVFAHDDIR